MALWAGHGAASVIKYDQNAILLERAVTGESLVDIVYAGSDDIATRHICCVAALLHSQHVMPGIEMQALEEWFSDLLALPDQSEDWLISCARQAHALLRQQNETVNLHGPEIGARLIRKACLANGPQNTPPSFSIQISQTSDDRTRHFKRISNDASTWSAPAPGWSR